MNKRYNEMRCIWMDSGLVDYKLCDENFECEKCQFDKVMRNMVSENSNTGNKQAYGLKLDVISSTINKISSEEFNKYNIYLRNHLYLKNLFLDKYYIGLSPVLYHLFDNTRAFSICTPGRTVKLGNQLIKIEGDWGSVVISSPIALTCLKPFKQDEYNDISSRNLLGLIEVKESELKGKMISEEKFEHDKNFVINNLYAQKKIPDNVGETFHDGGQKIKAIYEVIGKDCFADFIKGVLEFSNK